jgi:hypothetical protein
MGTRSTVSATVRHLLISRGMRNADLADRFAERGRRVSRAYMSRKIYEERWTMEDLDFLAEIFRLEPADFVRGYRYIKENHEFSAN